MEQNQDKTELFLSLLMANQRSISSYISILVPCFEDANDILQETIAVMWKKFDQYAAGTDFAAWGVKIAYFLILHYRRDKTKKIVFFNEDLFSQINAVAEQKYGQSDEKLKALRSCIGKLDMPERHILELKYEMNNSVRSIAQRLGKSIQSTYRLFSKVHLLLHNCILRQLLEERSNI